MTGATGNAGGAVVEALRAAAEDVRPVSRSGGVDLNDPASVPFEGASAAFFSNALRWLPQLRAGDVEGTLDESEVLPTVEEIIGRPPRSFAQWAAKHAGDFG